MTVGCPMAMSRREVNYKTRAGCRNMGLGVASEELASAKRSKYGLEA